MDQNEYMEEIKRQVWWLSKSRHDILSAYWELFETTEELYRDYAELAPADRWKERLQRLGLLDEGEEDEPEEEPEPIDHEAVTNYALKCAETYEKAHPGDRKTVEEFLGTITWGEPKPAPTYKDTEIYKDTEVES